MTGKVNKIKIVGSSPTMTQDTSPTMTQDTSPTMTQDTGPT